MIAIAKVFGTANKKIPWRGGTCPQGMGPKADKKMTASTFVNAPVKSQGLAGTGLGIFDRGLMMPGNSAVVAIVPSLRPGRGYNFVNA